MALWHDPNNRGTNARTSKLDDAQLKALLQAMFVDGHTPTELAEMPVGAGLTKTALQHIRDGRTYTEERATILKAMRAAGLKVDLEAPYCVRRGGQKGRYKVAL